MMSNPLLTPYQTPFNSIPFSKISLGHYKPAMEKAMAMAQQEIEEIVMNPSKATFENTIEAFEKSGCVLEEISTLFFNLNSAETSDDMQALAQEISPLLTQHSNDIMLNKALFKRIQTAYTNTNLSTLTKEQEMLCKKTIKSFVRNGAHLNEEDKAIWRSINEELATSKLTFGEHVLKETNAFELWLSTADELAGLPVSILEGAKEEAKEKGRPNEWLFTLDYPSYMPFMTYAENRSLREQLHRAYNSRACQANDNNNETLVQRIVALRQQKAQLLGYPTYCDYVLEERMAENTTQVNQFLDDLLVYAKPKGKKEIEELQAFADTINGPTPLMPWDFSYYAEKLKTKKYAINDEILKPFFPLEQVVEGAFLVAKKLFGLQFTKLTHIDTYHKDVVVYEVTTENKEHIALFYADFFPRKGKRGGAWMTSFKGQHLTQRPHISIVCNFNKPSETTPSLLTFNEVTTLFHEFGHALHGLLANTTYESLSGTNVYWDFVELPSQLMENWCYEKECLDLFAKHYQTNEPIPIEYIEKIKESALFLAGYQTLRQLSFGKLDMAWHQLNTKEQISVFDFEEAAMKETQLFPKLKNTSMSCSFSHIFQGGYASGYYSYKWAEVLEADAFEEFEVNGIFDKATATLLKDTILSQGGSQHPMELYLAFKGRKPSVHALLKKSGLIAQ